MYRSCQFCIVKFERKNCKKVSKSQTTLQGYFHGFPQTYGFQLACQCQVGTVFQLGIILLQVAHQLYLRRKKSRNRAGAEIEWVPRVPGTRKILRSYLIKVALSGNLIYQWHPQIKIPNSAPEIRSC